MLDELTEKQRLFCDLIVGGVDSHEAAQKAGYSDLKKMRGSATALRSSSVKRELARRCGYELSALGPMAVAVLKKLLTSDDDRVRLAAVREVLCRLPVGSDKTGQQDVKISINLRPDDVKSIEGIVDVTPVRE